MAPTDFLENAAIDDILSDFQSRNTNTASVTSISLLFLRRVLLIRELNISFFHVGDVFVLMGFFDYLICLLSDLISFNRQLLEMTLERTRKLELERIDTHSQPNPDA